MKSLSRGPQNIEADQSVMFPMSVIETRGGSRGQGGSDLEGAHSPRRSTASEVTSCAREKE